MKYRLIALDLDGTLLADGRTVSEEDKKAIAYAMSKDVTVVVATGRVTQSGRVFSRMIGAEAYIISSNGARIFDLQNRKVIYEDGLDINDAKAVAGYFESLGVYYHAYVDDVMYVRYDNGPLLFYTEQNKLVEPDLRMDIRLCDDYDAVFEKNRDKISKVMTIEDDLDLIAEMKQELIRNQNIVIMKSHDNNLEIMNKTVAKGSALMHLAGHLGIPREEIIAIGDNDNDISMIKWAGMGIAMGNAIDELKAEADDITESCGNSGVAKAIYKHVR